MSQINNLTNLRILPTGMDLIIHSAQLTKYDFRNTANPDDPLKHLFNDWVDYYQLKFAIAQTLKPATVLDIGVGFGYAAAAFLNGYDQTKYTGIDLDTDTCGGVKEAINWAQEITQQFNTEFIIADTQKIQRLPGDIYDLININSQPNGDGFVHNLQLAIHQSHYVLVDGFLGNKENFNAVSDFLFRYADLVSWYSVIPGYRGQLLIKVARDNLPNLNGEYHNQVNSSLDIRQTYTNHYYTQDCGGFDVYKKNQGKKLEDSRLQAIAAISSLKSSGQVLDIGCGRGELTYYFANQGFSVTSVDYSPKAIELAKTCFHAEAHLAAQVKFICGDVGDVVLSDRYDLAVASDVIEHLSPAEVEALYHRVAQHIHKNGLFIIHTFPNLWYYQYHYPRQRKIAAAVGAYLPVQPRSRYELLMHINEQSPRVLKKQLSQHFGYVCLWFAHPEHPGGSLLKKFTHRDMCAAPSLFAVASHAPINQEQLKNHLQMLPTPSIPPGQIQLWVKQYPLVVSVNTEFEMQLEIANTSSFIFNSYGSHPVHISYHWMNEQGTDYLVFDGERNKIIPNLAPTQGKSFLPRQKQKHHKYQIQVKAPPQPGNYKLRVTLVQEGVRWFDTEPTNLAEDIYISIL